MLSIIRLRQLTPRFRVGIALGSLTCFWIVVLIWQFVTGTPFHLESSHMTLGGKLLLYAAILLVVWSGFQIFDILFPHWFRSPMLFWTKLGWLAVLLLWPIGPLVYYLFVYIPRTNEASGEPKGRVASL